LAPKPLKDIFAQYFRAYAEGEVLQLTQAHSFFSSRAQYSHALVIPAYLETSNFLSRL